MEKYRRSDQYYYDEYDRQTIEALKEKEAAILAAEKSYLAAEENDREELFSIYQTLQLSYSSHGADLAREKEREVKSRIAADERKDEILRKTPAPENVQCRTCGGQMELELTDFTNEGYELLFFFGCPLDHAPRRAFYASGREYLPPKRTCSYCNGELRSKKKKTKYKLIFTDTCKECGKVETIEFEIAKLKDSPIDENDRKKYCIDFIGRRNFFRDLKALADLELPDMPAEEEQSSNIKVQKLNIAAVEKLLGEATEKSGFIKLQFGAVKTGSFLTVDFSLQDPIDREEAKSIKSLKGLIEHTLFSTNWRLVPPGIACTLGHLSGQLNGYADQQDIKKIEKEIRSKKQQKKKA